ncbi:MAG: valine--tRNA ligase, partial [Pseudomonadota bacterium]
MTRDDAMALDPHYDAQKNDIPLYQKWEEAGAFKAKNRFGQDGHYTIVIPPPNITGSLHMGHALNNALQDILIRMKRMQGFATLWQPGTDHASIATQMVVERKLAEEGKLDRKTMGREAFLQEVWKWREQSGTTITNQLRKLGASCDWSRERFTMDKGLSRAVLKVFVQLHRDGYIYKDKRLANWDPKMETVISDLEVVPREIMGQLWTFRYPLFDDDKRFIAVATTRPETMLGDVAVAVHPSDERYRDLIGKQCRQPITGRALKIIADHIADPEQGTGAVKITPAHDFNDFAVGERHNLEMVNIFTAQACLNENVPKSYQGLDRFDARSKIIADMEKLDLYEGVTDHQHFVPYGDRGGVPVEPMLTDQWFVDAKRLSGDAIQAVEDKRTIFVPDHWTKVYYEWMENIQPWCISRQLWWGHRIPAWYGPDGHTFVAENLELAQKDARAHYGKGVSLHQDEDVLDTWFSSALWPFSTLGWPDETPELQHHYPTNVLVTGFDIIFFWVARMIMFGLYFCKEIPFGIAYVHALVRDEKGQKMSKSKGNVVNPIDLIDQYGADVVRFSLATQAAPGRDIKLSIPRMAGYRNFVTKIWNVARFLEHHDIAILGNDKQLCTAPKFPINRWIVASFDRVITQVQKHTQDYMFHTATHELHQFVWGQFCDWYVEFAKIALAGDEQDLIEETRCVLGDIFQKILHLTHPFMPFVTEYLWQYFAQYEGMLITRKMPELVGNGAFENDEALVQKIIAVISAIRSARAQVNVPASAVLPVFYANASKEDEALVADFLPYLTRLARIAPPQPATGQERACVRVHVGHCEYLLPLEGIIDMQAEVARISKDIAKREGLLQKDAAKLSNQGFLAKAPEHVVAELRTRHETEMHEIEELQSAL